MQSCNVRKLAGCFLLLQEVPNSWSYLYTHRRPGAFTFTFLCVHEQALCRLVWLDKLAFLVWHHCGLSSAEGIVACFDITGSLDKHYQPNLGSGSLELHWYLLDFESLFQWCRWTYCLPGSQDCHAMLHGLGMLPCTQCSFLMSFGLQALMSAAVNLSKSVSPPDMIKVWRNSLWSQPLKQVKMTAKQKSRQKYERSRVSPKKKGGRKWKWRKNMQEPCNKIDSRHRKNSTLRCSHSRKNAIWKLFCTLFKR